jgi:hypothetical protein
MQATMYLLATLVCTFGAGMLCGVALQYMLGCGA